MVLISAFIQILSLRALSATVGTGNIVGVAGAMLAGGPGAVFWMFIAACIGMATKYAEGLLAVKYRVIDKEGHALGGPFYYIERGMGRNWKWLAKIFAFFGVGAGLLGIGTITQVNGISTAVNNFADPNGAHIAFTMNGIGYTWATLVTAVVVAAAVALVVIGGIKRIASVSSVVVPFMMVLYVVVCVAILIVNIQEIPAALRNQYWGEYYRGAAGAKQSGFCFKAQHCTERSIRNKILDQIIACNGVFVGAGVPVYLRRLYRN